MEHTIPEHINLIQVYHFYSNNMNLLNYILHWEDNFQLDCIHIDKVWVGWLNLEN